MPEPGTQKEELEKNQELPVEGKETNLNEPAPNAEKAIGAALAADAETEKIIERNRQQVENGPIKLDDKMEGGDKLDGKIEKKVSQESERKIVEQFDKEKPTTNAAASDDDDEEDKKKNLKKHADQVYQISDPEQQIEKIVQLAIAHDPYYAVKVAKHLDDNYVLNEVHDRLVEEQVREELIKRGLLEEL